MTAGFLNCAGGGRPKNTHFGSQTIFQVSVELERALPALREAEEALNVLTKKDISELKVRGCTWKKAFAQPFGGCLRVCG